MILRVLLGGRRVVFLAASLFHLHDVFVLDLFFLSADFIIHVSRHIVHFITLSILCALKVFYIRCEKLITAIPTFFVSNVNFSTLFNQ